MAIEFQKNLVRMSSVVGVEDAEALLEWLQDKPNAKVDFSTCEHLHPANIQVLLAAGTAVKAWPDDARLAGWLKSIFPP
jgi:hypothetical protein